MAVNLKSILNQDTYNIIKNYNETGKDAISLLGYHNSFTKINEVVNSFHALANPQYLSHITNDFGNKFFNSPYEINKQVSPYFNDSYNAFALKSRDFQTTKIKFPLVKDYNIIDKKFFDDNLEKYNALLQKFANTFSTEIFENESGLEFIKIKNGKLRTVFENGVGILKAFGRKLGRILTPAKTQNINFEKFSIKSSKIGFEKSKISLSNNVITNSGFSPVNMPISKTDKMVAVVDHFVNRTLKKLNLEYANKTLFNKTPNPKKYMFASQILTDIFVCQALDLGANNAKVDHALKLQFSNLLSTFDENESKFLPIISKNAELATKVMLTNLQINPNKIIENRQKMGITYKNSPKEFYEILFGETKNDNLKEASIDMNKPNEKTIIYTNKAEIFKDFEQEIVPITPVQNKEEIQEQPKFQTKTKIAPEDYIPDEDLFEDEIIQPAQAKQPELKEVVNNKPKSETSQESTQKPKTTIQTTLGAVQEPAEKQNKQTTLAHFSNEDGENFSEKTKKDTTKQETLSKYSDLTTQTTLSNFAPLTNSTILAQERTTKKIGTTQPARKFDKYRKKSSITAKKNLSVDKTNQIIALIENRKTSLPSIQNKTSITPKTNKAKVIGETIIIKKPRGFSSAPQFVAFNQLKAYQSNESLKPFVQKSTTNDVEKEIPEEKYLWIDVPELDNKTEVVFNKSYITSKQVAKAIDTIYVKAINELHASTIKQTLTKKSPQFNAKIKMIEFWQTSLTGTKYTEKQEINFVEAKAYLTHLEKIKQTIIEEIFHGEDKLEKEKLEVSSAQSLVNKYFKEKTQTNQFFKTYIKNDMQKYAEKVLSSQSSEINKE